MLAQEIIRCKRDGQRLQRHQIDAFVRGLVEGVGANAILTHLPGFH